MASDPLDPILSRRTFLGASLAAGAASILPRQARWLPAAGAPAVITAERLRPVLPSGVQVGDVLSNRAMLWSRADRPARMHIDRRDHVASHHDPNVQAAFDSAGRAVRHVRTGNFVARR